MAGRISTRPISSFTVMLAILAACLPAMACKPAPPPDEVKLLLNWYHEAEFAGYYAAVERGFYKRQRITLEIQEGGPGIGTTVPLKNKEVDFAIATEDVQRRRMVAGDPTVTVLAAFQIPPTIFFSLAGSGIRTPADLVGRRVAVDSTYRHRLVQSLLRNAKVDPASVVEVEVEGNPIEKLFAGEVDVWFGFVHDEPVQARMAGHEVNLIFLADYGIGTYEGLLLTLQETIDTDPDLVARFVKATQEGWRYVVEHPDAAADIVAKWQPGETPEFHRLAVRALVSLVDTGQVPIGWIDEERWKTGMGDAYAPDRPGYSMAFQEPPRR